MKWSWCVALLVLAVVTVEAQRFRLPVRSRGPAGVTAHLWVDTDGGTCTRNSSPAAYVDAAACSSFDGAYDAATTGDTIRVTAGTYGGQGTVGDDSKTITIIGAGPTQTVIDSLTANGSTGSPSAYNTLNFSDNLTIKSVGVTGDYPIVAFNDGVDNATWEDFRLTGRESRTCSPGSDEPLKIQSDTGSITNITLRDGYIGPFKASRDGQGGCSGDTFHLEMIRIGKDVDGVVIDRVEFDDCPSGVDYDGCNTAHILITTPNSGELKPRNLAIRNSRFGVTHGSQPNVDIHNNVTTCTGYEVAYITFDTANPFTFGGCTGTSSVTVVGSLGSRAQNNCSTATWTKNVWQWSTGTACGTDTRVQGDNSSVDQLGINATTGKLEAGSAAIDAGEATCASTANGEDIDLQSRPLGSGCDAGWDERS